MQATVIIERTNEQQIAAAGQRLAFGPMHFAAASKEQIQQYAERLAERDGIESPSIIILADTI